MIYRRAFFDPPSSSEQSVTRTIDDEPPVYHFDPQGRIVLAINTALATARPLLIRGPTGCGKSSLARYIAHIEKWDYLHETITSRTEARDLLWTFDAVQRLGDAQTHPEMARQHARYVSPGVLWRAFDPMGAADFVAASYGLTPTVAAKVTQDGQPEESNEPQTEPKDSVVVLIDEIDKAEPELPNDLLTPLEEQNFAVADIAPQGKPYRVERARETVLLVITSNQERILPAAFLRRCVVLDLPAPDRARLAAIGSLYFPQKSSEYLDEIARLVVSSTSSLDRPAAIAEYLDVIRAADALGIDPDDGLWSVLVDLTVQKTGASLPQPSDQRR